MSRRIRVQSSALGYPTTVDVRIYDTLDAMRAAATRYSPGEDFSHAAGVTHCTTIERVDSQGNTLDSNAHPIIRLARDHLGTEVITHEMTHAASAIYGNHIHPETLAVDVLHNANEDFAYLVGELARRLVDRLYTLGYYQETP